MEVEGGDKTAKWVKWLRVRLSLNVNNPLKRGSSSQAPEGNKLMVAFRYEKLPDFCYVYGRLTHIEQDCPVVIALKNDGKEVKCNYDPWLRADGHKLHIPKQRLTQERYMGDQVTKPASEAWWLSPSMKTMMKKESTD